MINVRQSIVDEAGVNWLKGVLLLFVVFDHNNHLRALFPDVFRPLTFHVVGFFVLAFPGAFYSNKKISVFVLERAFRYLLPFLVVYTFYSLAYFLAQGGGIRFGEYIYGMVFGSFALVKRGCGGAFMWFLPALFGFSCLVRFLSAVNSMVLTVFLCFSGLFYFFISSVYYSIKVYQLFGFGIAVYVLPSVFCIFFLNNYFINMAGGLAKAVRSVFALCGALAYAFLVFSGVTIELGALTAPPANRWDLIFASFFSEACILVVLFQLSNGKFLRFEWLDAIGKSSLIVYLAHPFFLAILGRAISLLGMDGGGGKVELLCLGFAETLIAVLLSLYVAKFFSRNPRLQAFVFPRNCSHFMRAFVRAP